MSSNRVSDAVYFGSRYAMAVGSGLLIAGVGLSLYDKDFNQAKLYYESSQMLANIGFGVIISGCVVGGLEILTRAHRIIKNRDSRTS